MSELMPNENANEESTELFVPEKKRLRGCVSDVKERSAAVGLVNKGKNIREVAKKYSVSVVTIYNWMRAANERSKRKPSTRSHKHKSAGKSKSSLSECKGLALAKPKRLRLSQSCVDHQRTTGKQTSDPVVGIVLLSGARMELPLSSITFDLIHLLNKAR